MSEDTALDIVLASYREMFGVKTERGNELHRDACIEVWHYRQIAEAAQKSLPVFRRLVELHHKRRHTGDFETCNQDTCIVNRACVAVLSSALDDR